MNTRRDSGVSGFFIRLIATITMLADHIGAIYIAGIAPVDCSINFQGMSDPYVAAYTVLRCIGRLAFPLYCFLLVEGFIHTHDRKKYMLRLFALALVSEVALDLALFDRLIDFRYNCVIWTLLLGLICMSIMERTGLKPVYNLVIVGALALLGRALKLDYGAEGVIAIAIMYLYRNNRCLAYFMAAVVLGLFNETEFISILTLPLIYLYNGQRGHDSKAWRIFFYAFYPLHLFILWILV